MNLLHPGVTRTALVLGAPWARLAPPQRIFPPLFDHCGGNANALGNHVHSLLYDMDMTLMSWHQQHGKIEAVEALIGTCHNRLCV